MTTILSVSVPRWADATQIDVIVDVETTEYGVLEFTASASDVEAHGREIHAAALAGAYGPIAAYEPPPAPPPPSAADLKAAAAAKRWQVETGGVVAGGMPIDTSRASQAMISGAHAYIQAQPSATVDFKAASGWVTLDAAAVTTIALAVAGHVQSCFGVERLVEAALDAGTITTLAEIDAADWPSNG